eukprot:9480681-Pyramimonas_sp.AAC.1
MELYYCELYQVHPQERRQYMGRGKLQEPVKQPMDGGKPWPTTSDASSRWWSTVASHLNELAHVRAGQKACLERSISEDGSRLWPRPSLSVRSFRYLSVGAP